MTPAQTQKARAALRASIRSFFADRSYDEVDTPVVVVCPGTETYLRFFGTRWQDSQGKNHDLWLRSSPELAMKQLVAAGMDRIYQLAPCFRNAGERADWHHPEFTMLEWYRKGAQVEDFLEETCQLLYTTRDTMEKKGYEVAADLKTPVQKWSVKDIVAETTGLELLDGDDELGAKAADLGITSIEPADDFETAFFKLLLLRVEPYLRQIPLAVLYDYPASQAALARVEGGVAKRFEFYVRGVELSNGFFELQDPEENKTRIAAAFAKRQQLGFEVPGEDHSFYECLASYPESCGNALGFDRWLACLLQKPSLDTLIPLRHQIFTDRGPL